MIRFCDKEVACILENQLDRQQLLEYFMNGHRSDIVCVLDEKGKLIGSITYLSLLGQELEQSVNQDYILLDENAWKEGRKCLDRCIKQFGVENLVPVTDKERNLLCFAYEDPEADQELRMLDELKEHKSAVGFCDLYPQYEHVTVHGCNELAYQFVCYLTEQNISFRVTGNLWEKFDTLQKEYNKNNNETLDYKTLDIYSEGTYAKDERIELRPSVSPEFECIDKIYEANILNGIIRDADKKIEDVLKFLKGKTVAILGIDQFSLNAYDFLIAHDIDICCFISDMYEKKMNIFSKKVLKRVEAMQIWGEDIVFVQADKKYSAWGFGEVNLYHSLGYKRNKSFFLLQDYIDVPKNGLKNIFKNWLKSNSEKLVLLGDKYLCMAMGQALEAETKQYGRIMFCDILDRYKKDYINMNQIQGSEIRKEDFCCILLPRYNGCSAVKPDNSKIDLHKDFLERHKKALEQYDIINMIDYPFEDVDWMRAENLFNTYEKLELRPKKIILGAINYYSGNTLFKGILNEHPNVIVVKDNALNSNLYSFCVRLSMERSDRILSTFWKLYEEIRPSGFPDRERFGPIMERLLRKKNTFTSQQLFVLIFIAYAELEGKINDISNMVIYWEPHCVERDEIEYYSKWLDDIKSDGYFVNIVRNSCMSSGSNLKNIDANKPLERILATVYYQIEKIKEYAGWKRIVMKFENLKRNPKEELFRFCQETGIEWSDKFLDVTAEYQGVSGFDLTPVYRTWEEYYSSFDRFRICLAKGPWQRKYGYSYVNSLDFSRKELHEMFMKKFRFEEEWDFASKELENVFLNWRKKWMNQILWEVRRKNILQE